MSRTVKLRIFKFVSILRRNSKLFLYLFTLGLFKYKGQQIELCRQVTNCYAEGKICCQKTQINDCNYITMKSREPGNKSMNANSCNNQQRTSAAKEWYNNRARARGRRPMAALTVHLLCTPVYLRTSAPTHLCLYYAVCN